jgi:galactose oxidase
VDRAIQPDPGLDSRRLLHTGKVLLFSWPNNTVGSDAVLWDPASGKIINIALTYQRDVFCGGPTVLQDGRVFIAGGHIYQGALQPTQGVNNTTIFDPAANSWTEGPVMSQARWYPTATLLGDGTVIICGGTINTGASATTVDHYDPVSNTLTTPPSTASKTMVTYPRVKLLTSGLLAWTNFPTTCYLNPATATWTNGPMLNSGSRSVTDMSVLLPGLTTIMEMGGTKTSGVTSTAELLNLAAATPAWKYTTSMHFQRLWANSVVLADGTVLVVGGGATSHYGGPILTPEIYNPATRTWTEMAAQTAPRMYHSTALLLPDGRVLSAGQSSGKYENTGEIFSPPYLFKGARPVISNAPRTLGYGQAFTVTTPQAAGRAGPRRGELRADPGRRAGDGLDAPGRRRRRASPSAARRRAGTPAAPGCPRSTGWSAGWAASGWPTGPASTGSCPA